MDDSSASHIRLIAASLQQTTDQSQVSSGLTQAWSVLKDDPENAELIELLLNFARRTQHPEYKQQVALYLGWVAGAVPDNEQANTAFNELITQTQSHSEYPSITPQQERKPAAPRQGTDDPSPDALPADLSDLLSEADRAYYQEKFAAAEALYARVLQREPTDARAAEQLYKIRMRLYRGAPEEAISQSQPLPQEARILYRRARSYVAAGDYLGARDLLRRAIEIAEQANISYEEAKATLDSLDDRIAAEEYRDNGDQAVVGERWHEAIESYQFALNLDPEDWLTETKLQFLQVLAYADELIEVASRSIRQTPLLERLDGAIRAVQGLVDSSTHPQLLVRAAMAIAEKAKSLRWQLASRESERGRALLEATAESGTSADNLLTIRQALDAFERAKQIEPEYPTPEEETVRRLLGIVGEAESVSRDYATGYKRDSKYTISQAHAWLACAPDDPGLQQLVEVLNAEEHVKSILTEQSERAVQEATDIYHAAYARIPDPLLLKRAQLLITLLGKPRRLSNETADR